MSNSINSRAKRAPITITEKAAEQIHNLLAADDNKSYIGIRVGVIENKGCAGYKYYVEYADKINPMDEVAELQDIKVVIDAKSVMFLIGTVMDYIDDKLQPGFTFVNPNESGRCGCGESFTL